ncbi:MAG TPA: hypothetical protein PLX77_02015, partial [Candidatus Cloacimonadota bacterium]|nr:hypothetical protein [Candidatus Cloacimonadota bacterium]
MKISAGLERKLIYTILLIAVTLPLLIPIGWKTDISGYTQIAYDLVEHTPEETIVLISFDYDPSTMTELQPMAEAQIE